MFRVSVTPGSTKPLLNANTANPMVSNASPHSRISALQRRTLRGVVDAPKTPTRNASGMSVKNALKFVMSLTVHDRFGLVKRSQKKSFSEVLDIGVRTHYLWGMAKTMNNKELKKLLTGLSAQGCTVKSINDGYRVFPPNGGKIMTIHLTLSDARGMKNLRAEARRNGLDWPLD